MCERAELLKKLTVAESANVLIETKSEQMIRIGIAELPPRKGVRGRGWRQWEPDNNRWIRRPWIAQTLIGILGVLFCCLASSYAAEVVLIQGKQTYPYEEDSIRSLTDFYGIDLRVVDSTSHAAVANALSELRKRDTLAVLASQEAISNFDRQRLRAAIARPKHTHIPMLVFGVQNGSDLRELGFLSDGTVQGCSVITQQTRPEVLEIENAGALTRMLSGIKLPAVTFPACSLKFKISSRVEQVLSMYGSGSSKSAVLVRAQSSVGDVFFSPKMSLRDRSWIGAPNSLQNAFSSLAPFILFLSYASGEYGWHSDGLYANLTIDDAWLTQPYGHFDYYAVLREMQKHNFHTTVAFVPWNFDRSESDLVRLFREHPTYYSVCMHGNNHAHREFGTYGKNSLQQQTADIKQGIARMERFRALTGLPYDRFMVFPHAVAPEQTFAALKTYDFLGTANASNVPIGVSFPTDLTFLLRPYTASYQGLLSFYRYPASGVVPKSEIAIHSFLGNPLLFYSHENLFEKGAGAFDPFSDFVNQLQAETRWLSLAEIARHSHLLRRRMDGSFDVWMLSTEMDLVNPTENDLYFHIHWDRSSSENVAAITIDGSEVRFDELGNQPVLQISIPAYGVRQVRIRYRNDLNIPHESVAKTNIYVYALRIISDFRDLKLSRSPLGTLLIHSYYRYDMDSVELYAEQKWGGILASLVLALILLWYRRHRKLATARQHTLTEQESPTRACPIRVLR